jgi:hypothetical protein
MLWVSPDVRPRCAMSILLLVVLAILAVVGGSLLVGAVTAYRTRHHLRRVVAGRSENAAFATCLAAFKGIDAQRVRLAYHWVQELVDFPSAPICAEDELWTTLRVDQGEADDMFESSHEWRGDDPRGGSTDTAKHPKTVADLMAQILAFGYEGYANVIDSKKESRAHGLK